jgi:hypothetical protein
MSNLTTGHGPAPGPSSAAADAGAGAEADELASSRNSRRRRGCAEARHDGRGRPIGVGHAAAAAAAARGIGAVGGLPLVQWEGDGRRSLRWKRTDGGLRLKKRRRREAVACGEAAETYDHELDARSPQPAPRQRPSGSTGRVIFLGAGAPARPCAGVVCFCHLGSETENLYQY